MVVHLRYGKPVISPDGKIVTMREMGEYGQVNCIGTGEEYVSVEVHPGCERPGRNTGRGID